VPGLTGIFRILIAGATEAGAPPARSTSISALPAKALRCESRFRSPNFPSPVIPAQEGTQVCQKVASRLGARFRRQDEKERTFAAQSEAGISIQDARDPGFPGMTMKDGLAPVPGFFSRKTTQFS
jgi:hypothetical protein